MNNTKALYLEDSYQKECGALILEMGSYKDGLEYLILDETVMYPQGGGQPGDKGVIIGTGGSLKVKSLDYNNGLIKHIGKITGQLKEGDKVKVTIDWNSRFRNMQLHTAGHLLDLVVRQAYPHLTPLKGVHGIGKKLFIEYQGIHNLNLELLNSELSTLIQSSPSIETKFVSLEELKKLANWLPPKLPKSKKLRILSIKDSYLIPDGGTQLKTGETIWPIIVTTTEVKENSTLVHYQVTIPEHKKIENPSSSDSTKMNDLFTMISSSFKEDLSNVQNSLDFDLYRAKYNKFFTALMSELKNASSDDKKIYGPKINDLKKAYNLLLANSSSTSFANLSLKSSDHVEKITDPTVPMSASSIGHLHPTTEIIRELNNFFRYHGFSIGEGPEIEDVEYNFRRLNLPEGHPATDLQDSLFINEPNLLLRTHTSSIQTRVLSTFKPPLRVVVPGKCYRNETNNSTNSSFFYQYQGFVVDKGINIQNLKSMLTDVHKFLFGDDVILRYRYKYYPEVSPGMGIDMQCRFCQGKGCQVCKGRGWIETLGSGMTHYNCYKSCGIDPEIWTGYSFGMGLDRLVMSKYGIKDIRKLYGGEIVYK